MMFRLLTFVLAVWSASAFAETVSVLSGEHEDFSRLVIQFEEPTDWQVGRWENGYELSVSREDMQFDIAQIFKLIPRTRITNVDATAGRLRLTTTGELHADAFEIRQSRLVLDIKDGPAEPGSPFEVAIETRAAEDTEVATADPATPVVKQEEVPESSAPAVTLPIVTEKKPPAIIGDFDIPEPAAPPERVAEFERMILEQLGRAASQGLIEADLPEINALPALPAETPAPKPPEVPVVEVDPSEPATHIKVQTRADKDAPSRPDPRPITTEGVKCLPSDVVAIVDWGGPNGGPDDLADLRANLLGEFDEVSPTAVLDLARHYVYLTFGAEAKTVLTEFGVIVENADIIRAMAEIMDEGFAADPGRLGPQMSCTSDAAMWSVLAQKTLSATDEINETAVLSAFSALPYHLRRYLGPILSERFIGIGSTDVASSIRSSISRAPGEHGAEFDMLDATLELALGNEDRALKKFEEVSDEGSDLSPEATRTLIEAQIASGQMVDAKRIEDAEIYAFERRGTDIGAELAKTSIRAVISNGDAETAISKIEAAAETQLAPQEMLNDLLDSAYTLLSRDASDVVFLKRVLGAANMEKITSIGDDSRRSIADRLVDLGFATEAKDVLNANTGTPVPNDRVLFSRIALAEGNAAISLGYLAGIEGPEADEVRARAFALAKNHTDAATRYAALDQPEPASREAFLARDWQLVDQLGAGAQKGLAAELTADPSLRHDMPPLARNQDLIDQSARVRELLNDLVK